MSYSELRWSVDVVRYVRLDRSWRTENFPLTFRIVPYCRIYLPLSGEGFIAFGGREYRLIPNHLFLVPAFAATQVHCDNRLEMYWSNFNIYLGQSDLDFFSLVKPDYEIEIENTEFFCELFRRMSRYCNIPLRGKHLITEMERFEVLAELRLAVLPFLLSAEKNTSEDMDFDESLKFLQYIESHLHENLKLSDYATVFHLNPTYLTNFFSRRMGRGLMKYVHERKLNKAILMLSTQRLRISEAAYAVDFDDPNNFTRFFRKHLGITPTRFMAMLPY